MVSQRRVSRLRYYRRVLDSALWFSQHYRNTVLVRLLLVGLIKIPGLYLPVCYAS